MDKVVLFSQGNIKNETKSRVIDDDFLTLGLSICLDKLSKMKSYEEIEDYLSFGDDETFNLKEDIARLLLIATTFPTNLSPTVDISKKLMDNHITYINSMFIKEFLELEARNKTTSFMKSDFYYQISKKVEEIELKSLITNEINLSDSIILFKYIRNLYKANVDKNIINNKLDVRYREPLIELFQHNLDFTQEKIMNGGKKDVQLQARY